MLDLSLAELGLTASVEMKTKFLNLASYLVCVCVWGGGMRKGEGRVRRRGRGEGGIGGEGLVA